MPSVLRTRPNISCPRPTAFALISTSLLVLLVLAADSGFDLQHAFFRILWPFFGGAQFIELVVYWIEPSRTIAQAPLLHAHFGWPACLICLIVFGARRRYRRTGPVVTLAVLSIFGYFALVLACELALLTTGFSYRHTWFPGYFHAMLAVLFCNILVAMVVWRWTRSRLMVSGLILLALLGPVQYAVVESGTYFNRLISLGPIPSGSHSRTHPSSFDKLVGAEPNEYWLNELLHNTFESGGYLNRTSSIPIVYETYTNDSPPYEERSYASVHLNFSIPFGISYNLGVLVLACAAVARSFREDHRQCFQCGYSLSGLPAGAPCPECGTQTSSPTASITSSA